MPEGPLSMDGNLLNGPKLAGDEGHASQDDIDALFGYA
jgi:chemotaxis protein CheZ